MPILGGDGFDDPKVVEKAGKKFANNVFFSAHYSSQDTDSKVQEFIKKFRKNTTLNQMLLLRLGTIWDTLLPTPSKERI